MGACIMGNYVVISTKYSIKMFVYIFTIKKYQNLSWHEMYVTIYRCLFDHLKWVNFCAGLKGNIHENISPI